MYKSKGSSSSVSNYRPISITSCACKVLEFLIRDWMMSLLVASNSFAHQQHGFLPGRSTMTNTLSSVCDWIRWLDDGKYVDCIYLDVAKAFDTVSHPKLMSKLKQYGFHDLILSWIKEFLSNRVMMVKVEGCLSQPTHITSGVPQGSVLGPILFSLYVNDLASVPSESVIKMYADDTKLYHFFDKSAVPQALQTDLTNVLNWFDKWQLAVSLPKCQALQLSFTERLFYSEYHAGASRMESCTSVVDLGITISRNLKPHLHVRKICRKSFTMCNLIFRCFRTRSPDFLTKLFKTYVRPHLEYCSVCWNPSYAGDINALERVQRSYTKRIFPDISYPQRLFKLNLEPLELRRLKFDLAEVHKLVLGQSALLFENYFTYKHYTGTRAPHDFQLSLPLVRSEFAKCSFQFRVVNAWNALPAAIVNSPSRSEFLSRLTSFDLLPFLKCFNRTFLH